MPKVTTEIPNELSRQLDRVVREGWFADHETAIRAAIENYIGARSFVGDSPRMLLRFAADALNDSKPDVALRFADRGIALCDAHPLTDFALYQSLVEIRVQILLVLERHADALAGLEAAREKLPNNPSIAMWIDRLRK